MIHSVLDMVIGSIGINLIPLMKKPIIPIKHSEYAKTPIR